MVTDGQVKLLRKRLMEGKNKEAAAAAAGMSARTAREWAEGPLPSEDRPVRDWRTRKDPFEGVWAKVIEPLLKADEDGELQAKTVFDDLVRTEPGRFEEGQLRTLQRQFRNWRALNAPGKEVMFAQEHPPGREAAFDFTNCDWLDVTLGGVPFPHLLFVLRLSCGKWTYAELATGETWEAVSRGLQSAFWELGGCTTVVRHDNLSAATRELKENGGRSLTLRFRALLDHYGLESTRIAPGKSNENGVVEKTNDLLTSALDQALRLRGHREFPSIAAWVAFVGEIRGRMNQTHHATIEAERPHLRPLPDRRLPDFTEYDLHVRAWSTIRIRGQTYSVPSRLIGHEVSVRVYAELLEVRYLSTLTATMPRVRGKGRVVIDYRHVIWSLVRKPGAFARYRYREELFPTLVFRKAYDALVGWRGDRADVEYVRILHLAASTLQGPVERALVSLLEAEAPFDYAAVKALANPEPVTVPDIRIGQPDLSRYDLLLAGGL